MRTRAERRKIDYKKAIRKKNICEHIYGLDEYVYYDNLHQYSKNKIHCSCPMCTKKTNNSSSWGMKRNYTHADRVKIDSMDSQFEEM